MKNNLPQIKKPQRNLRFIVGAEGFEPPTLPPKGRDALDQ
jgi:hypothetical protein